MPDSPWQADGAVAAPLDRIPFDNSYARLPEQFYARVRPTAVRDPRLVRLNRPLAERLGLDPELLASPEGVEMLAGNRVPATAEPIAMAYAGHQFGNYVPQLGDGRAVLLGELSDRDGIKRDLHLKGIGRTPFSRMGDGRSWVGPVLREYLASEAMAGLDIPTTRALAMVTTGEQVAREELYPGAVMARVAIGHVRVGSFEYFARQGDWEAVRTLADYWIDRYDPQLRQADNPYRALLTAVVERTADLIAQWLLVGFVHGVMNTDNVSLAGETIDYGPFHFMDTYHPNTWTSAVDMMGRYAYDQQPGIGHWNLARFAECLLPLLDEDTEQAKAYAYEALDAYAPAFQARYHAGLTRKIGLEGGSQPDLELAQALLGTMAEQRADFTLTFRRLCALPAGDASADQPVRGLFDDPAAFDAWAERWRARLARESRSEADRQAAMRAVNPAYVLRKHHVEQATRAAVQHDDYRMMDELLPILAEPYADHPGWEHYSLPPKAEEVVQHTFCGT
jgi:uncharacterized protein YdiU (UPF0061 family)